MTIVPAPGSRPLLEELEWRGLLHQQTEGCGDALAKGLVRGYCGFDPTAESLHVGNLVSILGLVRLARAGHQAVALVGGGTAMIGDPSGKSEERPIRSADEIRANAALIEAQIRRVVQNALGAGYGEGTGAREAGARVIFRNNADWLSPLRLIDFLRDTGKHFTVNWMMQKDSVKSRLDGGISFTEFSYMLLQAHDFLQMFQHDGVTLQLGGSDQWGNITAGTELIRRAARGEAHGLTFPLLTDASGKKFGKTEGGAVWLDATRTSPYQFYQFWVNADDSEVGRLLRTFTMLDRDAIEALEAAHAAAPHLRGAQKRLALEVTTMIHGTEAAALARSVSDTVFDKKADANALSDEVFATLAAEMPSVRLPASGGTLDVVAVLEEAFKLSKTAARKLVQQGAVSVNGAKLAPDATSVSRADAVRGRWLLVRKGGRDIAIAEIAG
ncbi:MAG: tyrosine--tRNA ligase [Gemmatimonadales bacterium]|nr:tyrosine--tRNA ligase [Gemmatimonadota bacterium]MCL4215169.1 tyrosine--tRNA ligase [Gemmatimonadales bacterium]